jgi:hypothetical protein
MASDEVFEDIVKKTDKLLESLIMTKGVNVKDLIVGDKNSLFIAARVLGYGKDYSFTYAGEEITVDLSLV